MSGAYDHLVSSHLSIKSFTASLFHYPIPYMALGLPNLMVIKSVLTERYAYYRTTDDVKTAVEGYACCQELNVFAPLAKIEVELAKVNDNYVHLRFYYSNKYWARGPNDGGKWIVASSNQPEEDTSKESCTLFEPTIGDGGSLYLKHVQSGKRLRTDKSSGDDDTANCIYLDDNESGDDASYGFTYVDWDTLVIMPKYVTFKGHSGKYLRGIWVNDHQFLKFSSDDGNQKETAYEVTMNPDGYLIISSKYFGKYWRRSPNWIWADTTEENVGKNNDTLFWPVKVDDNVIALCNAGNNRFCKSLTAENNYDCLNAAATSITTEARLQDEELVLTRSIYDVEYRLNDARVYNESPYIVGTGTASNTSQEQATMSVTISYQYTNSYSFNYSLAIAIGVEASITAGIPLITEEGIKISTEVTNTFEWGHVTETTITAQVTYEAAVPPMSTVTVHYIATKGTCSVPFSYTQHDKLSADGTIVTTRHDDGVYTGINCYNFRFEQV